MAQVELYLPDDAGEWLSITGAGGLRSRGVLSCPVSGRHLTDCQGGSSRDGSDKTESSLLPYIKLCLRAINFFF